MPKISPALIIRKRKTEIEQDLKKNPNDPRYSYFTPKKSKSAVWKNYQVLKFNDCIESYAQCTGCREILSYSSKSGTGSLLRHKCRIKHENNNSVKHISGEDDDENDEKREDSTNDDETTRLHEDFKESIINTPYDNNATMQKAVDNVGAENVATCDVTNNNTEFHKKDKYDAFGENVANEMRILLDVPDVQFQLKSNILKSILEANTQAHVIRKQMKK